MSKFLTKNLLVELFLILVTTPKASLSKIFSKYWYLSKNSKPKRVYD